MYSQYKCDEFNSSGKSSIARCLYNWHLNKNIKRLNKNLYRTNASTGRHQTSALVTFQLPTSNLHTKHNTFVYHLYNVVPTSKPLSRRCTHVMQMLVFAGWLHTIVTNQYYTFRRCQLQIMVDQSLMFSRLWRVRQISDDGQIKLQCLWRVFLLYVRLVQ